MESKHIRFANILKFNNRSQDIIFNVVKTVKSKTFIENVDYICQTFDNVLKGDVILSLVKDVEKKLQIESSDQIFETMTNEHLKSAGEIFLYLAMCPTKIMPWVRFYEDLFQTQSPDQIILTLNRVMKGTKRSRNEDFKKKAEIIFRRIESMIPDTAKSTNFSEGPSQSFKGNY